MVRCRHVLRYSLLLFRTRRWSLTHAGQPWLYHRMLKLSNQYKAPSPSRARYIFRHAATVQRSATAPRLGWVNRTGNARRTIGDTPRCGGLRIGVARLSAGGRGWLDGDVGQGTEWRGGPCFLGRRQNVVVRLSGVVREGQAVRVNAGPRLCLRCSPLYKRVYINPNTIKPSSSHEGRF